MDLKQISYHQIEFQLQITKEDIRALEKNGYLGRQYFGEINTIFDISLYGTSSLTAYIGYIRYIEHERENEMNIFYKSTIKMSNGKCFERSFNKFGTIQMIPLDDFDVPIILSVTIQVGFYWGNGADYFETNNILTEIEDFIPICSPETDHTISMNSILNNGNFSDVTLICTDTKKILAHRCLLLRSHYFKALFIDFGQIEQNIVKVEYELETMKNLLSYLYSEKIKEENVSNWKNLFKAASFYQIEKLARHCQLQLMSRVDKTWNHITELFRFAIVFNATKLKRFLVLLTRRLQQTN
jgi:hypothetical protein